MAQYSDPFRDLVGLQERMNRLFQEAAERQSRGEGERDYELERADWIPLADVEETDEAFLIALDLPGIDRDALDISLDDNQLLIRGERSIESANQHRSERPRGRFARKFGIPAIVNKEAIAAEYKDGVLRLQLPKRTEPKASRVEIKVS